MVFVDTIAIGPWSFDQNMKRFKREASLKPFVKKYLHNQGYDVQRPEVRFFERRIDLMGFSTHDMKLVSIELKLHKWRKAFQQAILYQLCSDFVIVALPAQNTESIELDRFIRHGIGVLRVFKDGNSVILSEPTQSTVMKSQYKQRYIDFLKGYRYAAR